MATINDTFQGVTAAWEINQRLIYHTQPGRMLAGLKYDSEGTLKVDGFDDLPLLQPWTIGLAETLSPGAPKPETSVIGRQNQPVSETQTLVFRFASYRRDGWFRRDPTDGTKRKGFLEWLSLIRDSMETSADGHNATDAALAGASMKPLTFAIRESETTQLSFSCFLEVEIYLKHYCRAERGYTFP